MEPPEEVRTLRLRSGADAQALLQLVCQQYLFLKDSKI